MGHDVVDRDTAETVVQGLLIGWPSMIGIICSSLKYMISSFNNIIFINIVFQRLNIKRRLKYEFFLPVRAETDFEPG